MKLVKKYSESNSCEGCVFDFEDECTLSLLETLESVEVDVTCMTEQGFFIYVVEENSNES